MKVCSLYGVGFYYIPGTDICMKLGGYVRFQQNFGGHRHHRRSVHGHGWVQHPRIERRSSYRVRWLLQHDTRQQTAYGTLRTYMILGFTQDSGTDTDITARSRRGVDRIYVDPRVSSRLAGFTFGKATSYFDFVSSAAVAYNAGATSSPDTGDAGQWLLLTPLNSATACRARSRSSRNVLAASSTRCHRCSAARLRAAAAATSDVGRCSTGSRTSSATFASIRPGVLLRSQSLRITAATSYYGSGHWRREPQRVERPSEQ